MEPLKPRDKVTQHMTRDGLTLDNQTTGESVNVSSREAEQEYTAQPEGAAEKILERADELHDRHKAKKAAKDAGETVAQATGPVSRLQFTAEERASPELAPYIKKAEKRADKLEAAKETLPKKRVVTKETVYDEAKGKAKSRLYFDKVEKAPPQLKPNPASRPIQEAGLYLHGKIHEVEHENVGVEGGHKGEELAERQAGRMIRSGVHRHKLKPYRAAAKAERKSIAANAEFVYQKSMRNNPELAQVAKNPVSRFWQKQHIKREYAKAARAAGQTAQGAASTSFDCSGFISWVINHSGWNVGRQTAQGLYNICTPVSPEQAKPGDLVFFVGTYDTAGMSHVGLYVGNSVMLHCGDPISYTNLNSSYWQQHFYCYGRLP